MLFVLAMSFELQLLESLDLVAPASESSNGSDFTLHTFAAFENTLLSAFDGNSTFF